MVLGHYKSRECYVLMDALGLACRPFGFNNGARGNEGECKQGEVRERRHEW